MPEFAPHALDTAAARAEVQDLKTLLDSPADLTERQIGRFLRSRRHLQALVGPLYNPSLVRPDRLAWEYPLFGDFRCDFAVGDSKRHAYTLVEYEDAGPTSLFVRQAKKITRAWSRRLDAGYGQVIDWFYKLRAMTDTPDMEARFGKRAVPVTGVLVIGRDRHMDAGERMRFEWRRQHVVVDSKHIECVTYDQLAQDLLSRLDQYALAGGADK